MQMLGSRVLVKLEPVKNTTVSGLFISESTLPEYRRGAVLAVGPGDKENPTMTVKEGDIVLCHKNGGGILDPNEKDIRFYFERELVAIDK